MGNWWSNTENTEGGTNTINTTNIVSSTPTNNKPPLKLYYYDHDSWGYWFCSPYYRWKEQAQERLIDKELKEMDVFPIQEELR